MVSRAVENAQKQIEELNYERRKNVLKYDEVMNGQREVIYGERRKILEGQDIDEQALGFVEDVVRATVAALRARPTCSRRIGTSMRCTRRCSRSTRPDSPRNGLPRAADGVRARGEFVEDALAAYEAKESDRHAAGDA